MRRSDFIWSILVLTTATTFAFANAYKWENKNNEVEYSQMPPENQDATVIAAPPTPSSSAQEEKKAADALQDKFKKEDSDNAKNKAKEAIKAEEKRVMDYNCNLAKKYLADLQSKERIKLTTNGQTVLLSQEQRTEEIKKTEEAVKKYCVSN